MPDEDDQILIGTGVEQEHEPTYNWLKQCFADGVLPSLHAMCTHIARDHLKEKADYYTELEKAGL